ncbi:hypothetical protein B0T14DRAFT_509418 [Immersiella caudata]|uniref:Uncharacterized protein n=1 Tax=Immersiella caudata TaxID=314043 RepID=A0AA40C5Y2_9PEZI|nr:hypothetical protein B0T14DRAFT_509418 [Immersiella caudata]
MFEWYKKSHVCYVYLSDFEPLPVQLSEKERRALVDTRLRSCRWFTRGWTLQELVAPRKLEFYDRDWNFVGGREDLEQTLFEITGIDGDVLHDSSGLASTPIGRRMSWAVGRKTTRVEDRAYSLLGIFNINMPLLYGEGTQAFFRLQQEIASQSNDLSLFAWQCKPVEDEEPSMFSGVFAESPDLFWPCSTIKRHGDFAVSQEFAITNRGLRINGESLSVDNSSTRQFLLGLDCVRTVPEEEDDTSVKAHPDTPWLDEDNKDEGATKWVAIRLREVGNTFVRYMPATIATASNRSEWSPVMQDKPFGERDRHDQVYIQTFMRPDEILRVGSLVNTGVVLVYNEYLSKHLNKQWGLPSDPEIDQGEERRVFTFPTNLVDSFTCVHVVQIRSFSFAIVCKLQWTGSKFELRIGTFKSAAILPHRGSNPATPEKKRQELLAVKDRLLVSCSDRSGHLDQEKMRTTVEDTNPHGSYYIGIRAKPLRRLEKNPLGAVFTWRENYYHVEITSLYPKLARREGIRRHRSFVLGKETSAAAPEGRDA